MPLTLWANVPLDQRGAPWMTRRRHPRLWFTDDRRELVADGDSRATVLAIGENGPPPYAYRILFYRWLEANQPRIPAGCPAAVRDRHGLYHPCRTPGVPAGVSCAAHDPVTRVAVAERRRIRAWNAARMACTQTERRTDAVHV